MTFTLSRNRLARLRHVPEVIYPVFSLEGCFCELMAEHSRRRVSARYGAVTSDHEVLPSRRTVIGVDKLSVECGRQRPFRCEECLRAG
jgi:hypothetical protein